MNNFSDRHNGPKQADVEKMLSVVGAKSVDELISQTIPSSIRLEKDLDLPSALSETRFLEYMQSLAKKNKNYRSYIGMGYFNTILPLNFVIEILDVLYLDQALQLEDFDSIVIGDDAHKVPAESSFLFSPPSVIVAGLWIPIEPQSVTRCTVNIEVIKVDAERSFGWI